MSAKSLSEIADRNLPSNCLSDLVLDRLRCVDLAPEVAKAAERHLADCERCRNRAQTLTSESDALASELPALDTLLLSGSAKPATVGAGAPAKVTGLPRVRVRRAAVWGPVLAALSAAAAFVLYLTRAPLPEGEVRSKGASAELDIYVRRGEKVFRWQSQPLHPNDQLRYSFRAPEPSNVMILSREQSGAVNQYFPAEAQSFAVEFGVTLSKTATELDQTLGAETLWAVFCSRPFTADSLRAQLERDGTIAPAEGCSTQRLEFIKVAP